MQIQCQASQDNQMDISYLAARGGWGGGYIGGYIGAYISAFGAESSHPRDIRRSSRVFRGTVTNASGPNGPSGPSGPTGPSGPSGLGGPSGPSGPQSGKCMWWLPRVSFFLFLALYFPEPNL